MRDEVYICDWCGKLAKSENTKLILTKHCCNVCLPRAREELRKIIQEREQKDQDYQRRKEELARQKEIGSETWLNEQKAIHAEIERIRRNGCDTLTIDDLPIRLKRNEKVYFAASHKLDQGLSLGLIVTNKRLFIANNGKNLFLTMPTGTVKLSPGIKTTPLSTVIAIEAPNTVPGVAHWDIVIRLNKGSSISIGLDEYRTTQLLYSLLCYLVDRVNDPIDDMALLPKRDRLSDEVKNAVWKRDGGACVRCGSREKLEFDHIVPVSKGGSNTARNVELLCESCNRKKSNHIA